MKNMAKALVAVVALLVFPLGALAHLVYRGAVSGWYAMSDKMDDWGSHA